MEITGHHVSRRAALLGGAGASVLGASALAASSAEAAGRPVLVLGSTGSAVTEAQTRLRALGYWVGTPNGTFGHVTQQAVWALQKSAGARRSGRVDLSAWGLLARGVKPRPRSTSGSLIEVDIKRQLLMVVSNGKLLYTLNTSTGSGERYYSGGSWKTARTPTGSYSIYYRYPGGWQNGRLGSMWRPTYWKGDFAIHGSSSIPPYPASHGCCRVSTAAQDMLWATGWVNMGRKVWVY